MYKILNKRLNEEKISVADLEKVLPGRRDIYAFLEQGLNDATGSTDLNP